IRMTSGTVINTIVPGWKPGDVPVPGNYDDAKGYRKTKPAAYTPSTGTYTILGPGGIRTVTFSPNDVPAPAHYEGLRRAAPTVSPGNASGPGPFLITKPAPPAITSGRAGAIPVPAPYSYRAAGVAGSGFSAASAASAGAIRASSLGLGSTARALGAGTTA